MPISPGQKLDLATCTRQELLDKIERQKTQMQRNNAAYCRERVDYLRRFMALEGIKRDLANLLKRTEKAINVTPAHTAPIPSLRGTP